MAPARHGIEQEGKPLPDHDATLDARISNVLPTLTAKQRRLARYMLDNEIDLAFASADDVGRQAGVDAATVVRFARMLGYDGFADLRDSVRRGVPQFLTAVERVTQWLTGGQSDDVLQTVFAQDVSNLEKTARLNDPETIAKAVDLLGRARHVACIGHGISGFIADHLAHQLALVGVPIQRPSRGIVDGAIDLSLVSENDVVVVISVWRYLMDTLLLAEGAVDRGARVIALTDSRAAPIAAHADVALTAATETPELSHSGVGLITLTNVLATGVAVANPERTLACLQRVDHFYQQFAVMAVHPMSSTSTPAGRSGRRKPAAGSPGRGQARPKRRTGR